MSRKTLIIVPAVLLLDPPSGRLRFCDSHQRSRRCRHPHNRGSDRANRCRGPNPHNAPCRRG